MGFIGGQIGYRLLKAVSRYTGDPGLVSEACGQNGSSKLEAHFGPSVWDDVKGKTVIDFGCGKGVECVELALRGAAEVIGFDNRDRWFEDARRRAERVRVGKLCSFSTSVSRKADLVFSLDSFEHFEDPSATLEQMSKMLKPGGEIWISFGWPWYHAYGGHLFSVFPWAHLIFSESALIRWRSDYKNDGATRFEEVDGGLNQMSIARFEQIVRDSRLRCVDRCLVPIRPLRWLHHPFTREFTTALVQCRLMS